MERAGLFLVPLDEVRGWWRYHHLFADLLRARLQQEQPGRAAQLHRNAAAWYDEHEMADDAIRHAVAAGEMLWAARIIEQHFDERFYLRGEGSRFERWLSALPGDLVRTRPRLLLAQAIMAATAAARRWRSRCSTRPSRRTRVRPGNHSSLPSAGPAACS